MNRALVLVIENSKKNMGAGESWDNGEHKATHEPLEEEAIRCLKAWNKFAPTDISVYVICPSKRKPRASTVKSLEKLGATYIHVPLPEAETFTCGYFNVPLALNWFTENYNYDTIIHIDLDMYMFRPVPDDLFTIPEEYDAKIGRLTENEMKDEHIIECPIHFETCFMVATPDIYRNWWELTRLLISENRHRKDWNRYAELEEFAVDIMWKTGRRIKDLCYYQIGKRYPVSDIPDELLENVHFVHNHLYEPDVLGYYIARMLKYDKTKKNTTLYKM